MSKALPPLDQLRAFEAAARHLSFKLAAVELHVSPAAVGQRVRALEQRLETELFIRRTRQIALTERGQALFEDVSCGLGYIRRGLDNLVASKGLQLLVVSTTNSFAEKVLLPRLGQFTATAASCDVRIISTDEQLDPSRHQADICIRFGRGKYPGCSSLQLTDGLYIPVCSPSLVQQRGEPESPVHLRHWPLIEALWTVQRDDAPSWRRWFHSHGLTLPAGQPHINLTVEAHTINAAVNGQGIALANQAFIHQELAEGSLVPLLGEVGQFNIQFGHHLVWREQEQNPLVLSFIRWLQAQLA